MREHAWEGGEMIYFCAQTGPVLCIWMERESCWNERSVESAAAGGAID